MLQVFENCCRILVKFWARILQISKSSAEFWDINLRFRILLCRILRPNATDFWNLLYKTGRLLSHNHTKLQISESASEFWEQNFKCFWKSVFSEKKYSAVKIMWTCPIKIEEHLLLWNFILNWKISSQQLMLYEHVGRNLSQNSEFWFSTTKFGIFWGSLDNGLLQ